MEESYKPSKKKPNKARIQVLKVSWTLFDIDYILSTIQQYIIELLVTKIKIIFWSSKFPFLMEFTSKYMKDNQRLF